MYFCVAISLNHLARLVRNILVAVQVVYQRVFRTKMEHRCNECLVSFPCSHELVNLSFV